MLHLGRDVREVIACTCPARAAIACACCGLREVTTRSATCKSPVVRPGPCTSWRLDARRRRTHRAPAVTRTLAVVRSEIQRAGLLKAPVSRLKALQRRGIVSGRDGHEVGQDLLLVHRGELAMGHCGKRAASRGPPSPTRVTISDFSHAL